MPLLAELAQPQQDHQDVSSFGLCQTFNRKEMTHTLAIQCACALQCIKIPKTFYYAGLPFIPRTVDPQGYYTDTTGSCLARGISHQPWLQLTPSPTCSVNMQKLQDFQSKLTVTPPLCLTSLSPGKWSATPSPAKPVNYWLIIHMLCTPDLSQVGHRHCTFSLDMDLFGSRCFRCRAPAMLWNWEFRPLLCLALIFITMQDFDIAGGYLVTDTDIQLIFARSGSTCLCDCLYEGK
ncbi:hypothetical protein BDW69DRAFT_162776 [Aspergillus filifer]